MRLPIQSMQAVRLRASETDQWFRSVIVDFDPDNELVVLVPDEKDREKDDADVVGPESDGAEGADSGVAPGHDGPTSEGDPSPEPGADGDLAVETGEATAGEPDATQDVDDEILAPPMFSKGTKLDVEISFVDGIRRFSSVVRRMDMHYGGCLRIEWPTEGTRIQRRDYVRVEVAARTLIWFREGEGPLRKIEGFTVDFSAGGVRLKLTEPLPADLRIEMEIALAGLKAQALQGRVVRSGELAKKRNEPQYYWVAVEFVGVGESLRKDLTQLVFDIQREQMRKSLG